MNSFRNILTLFSAALIAFAGCGNHKSADSAADITQPQYLEIIPRTDSGWSLVSISPFDGSRDTLEVTEPLRNIIVMSTSHVGFLDAIGRTDVISGVSGLDYLFVEDTTTQLPVSLRSSNGLRQEGLVSEDTATLGKLRGGTGAERSEASGGAERSEASEPSTPSAVTFAKPVDVGYDSAPDYEKIVSLKPDLLLTYAVSGAKSQFITKLDQLGIKVFVVNEHLESHPLARASYIRLFGALTGSMDAADSVLDVISTSYRAIAESLASADAPRRNVLLNIPYNDQWFVPSAENYLSTMIKDAGGNVLGSGQGKAASSVMSVEKAYSLSKEADCWLNVGWCKTLEQLLSVNPIFEDMLANIRSNAGDKGFGDFPVVWNDNRRQNDKGGNDIWQSGVARPDLVLRDLASILHPSPASPIPSYYIPLD